MPFTLAHPVAVLPFLSRRYWSATGLIAGSIAPDFEYFFKMQSGSEYSHTVAGLFYFNLPVGILLSFVFHGLVKIPLIDNTPIWIQQRFVPMRTLDFIGYVRQNYSWFAASVLLGACTHLLWDSFTHRNGFAVQHIAFLYQTYIPYDGARYPLWYSLQHFFSVTGLLVMGVIVWRKKAAATNTVAPSVWFWVSMMVTAYVIYYLRRELGSVMNENTQVVAMMASGLLGLTLTSIAYRYGPKVKTDLT